MKKFLAKFEKILNQFWKKLDKTGNWVTLKILGKYQKSSQENFAKLNKVIYINFKIMSI